MTPDEEYEFLARPAADRAHARLPAACVIRIARQGAAAAACCRSPRSTTRSSATRSTRPSGPNDPQVLADARDVRRAASRTALGFTADFSSTMHSLSPTLLRTLAQMGLRRRSTSPVMQEIWREPTPDARAQRRSSRTTCASEDFDSGAPRPVHAPRVQHARPGARRRSGSTSCRRSSTCTRSSTTSTRTATSPRWTSRASCAQFVEGGYQRLPLQRVGGPRVRRPRRGRPGRLSCRPSTDSSAGRSSPPQLPSRPPPEEAPWPRTTPCSARPTSAGTPTG